MLFSIRKTKAPAHPRSRGKRIGGFILGVLRNSIAVFGILWLILEPLGFFDTSDFLREQGLYGYYSLWIHALLIGTFIKLARDLGRQREQDPVVPLPSTSDGPDQSLSNELVETVAKLYSKGDHIEVVRLGVVLSRPLWISGRYKQRVAIGRYLEDSAARLGLTREQVAALIDDLGWTNAVLGDIETGIGNVKHGIELAERNALYYHAAKGLRHLGVIEQIYNKNASAAQRALEQAEVAARRITEPAQQLEMVAGIWFNRGEVLLQQGDCSQARDYATRALDAYSQLHDETRSIKVQTLIAKIDLALGDLAHAKDGFRRALTSAKQLARRDEIGKSLLGLGETYLREGNFELAESTLEETVSALSEIGLKNELGRARDLLRRAKDRDPYLP
jgi:tetratricopeptide (TPR) repeat protein